MPFLREEVAHFAPIPDPAASYRGMSWLTPVVREIKGDTPTTTHKLKFFENGATPNLVVTLAAGGRPRGVQAVGGDCSRSSTPGRQRLQDAVPRRRRDATVVGADMKQVDFKDVQGAGETRIAAAAGVPPVIVGLSEGLQAATYSQLRPGPPAVR